MSWWKKLIGREPDQAVRSDVLASPDEIIRRFVTRAGALGVVGSVAVHSDVPILVLLWGYMIYGLARHYRIKLGLKDSMRIAFALMASAGTFIAGMIAANMYFKVTVVGVPAALTLNAGVDALLTCAVGVIVSMVFASREDDKDEDDVGGNGPGRWLPKIGAAFGRFLTELGIDAVKQWLRGGGSPLALRQMMEQKQLARA